MSKVAAVLIFQVVGMLPDVQAQYGSIACHQRAVLVACAFNDQFFLRCHAQPGPAAAKARERGLGEGLNATFLFGWLIRMSMIQYSSIMVGHRLPGSAVHSTVETQSAATCP